jgi:hypothetical protein
MIDFLDSPYTYFWVKTRATVVYPDNVVQGAVFIKDISNCTQNAKL